jgi:uncharacterized membrane protein
MSATRSISSALGGQLITQIAQGGKTSSSRSSEQTKFSSADQVSTTLNAGSRVFAKAFQNLNNAGTFINYSLATLENIEKIVGKVVALAERASKNGVGKSEINTISQEYRKLANDFNKEVAKATDGEVDALSKEDIATVLKNVGLDAEQITELSNIFAKFIPSGNDTTLADDAVKDPRVLRSSYEEELNVTRVSTSSAGVEGNGYSLVTSISDSGRFVAFFSDASNLVSGDTNAVGDSFLKDTLTGLTTRVSTNSAGTQANGLSFDPLLSANGSVVAFTSLSSNLVAGDSNGVSDSFIKDTGTGVTTRVSTDSAGTQGNGGSYVTALSANGRLIAFNSNATNLVAGDTNGASDSFIKDTLTGVTTRVSTGSAGTEGNGGSYVTALSADGRFAAFHSNATNLVPGDTNGLFDAFVKDTVTGVTTRVSTDSTGTQANGYSFVSDVSADGRYVAFYSLASNLVAGDTNGQRDAFIKDTLTGITTRVSTDSAGNQGNAGSYIRALSADGRYVVFDSDANNLVAGDTNGVRDSFIKDTVTGSTTRISTDSSGRQSNGLSQVTAISPDGQFLTLRSVATNLVPGDTNGQSDAFLYSRPNLGNEPSTRITRYDEVFASSRTLKNRGDGIALLADAKLLRKNIQSNIDTLKEVSNKIGSNMDLVRAVALGYLDGAKDRTVLAAKSAEEVASRVRGFIIDNANRKALAEVGNIDSVLAVTLLSDSSSTTDSGNSG